MDLFSKVNGGQVVIFSRIKHLVVVRKTWGYQFRHPSFYDALHGLGVLQLITDGYAIARADELWQIGVQ